MDFLEERRRFAKKLSQMVCCVDDDDRGVGILMTGDQMEVFVSSTVIPLLPQGLMVSLNKYTPRLLAFVAQSKTACSALHKHSHNFSRHAVLEMWFLRSCSWAVI